MLREVGEAVQYANLCHVEEENLNDELDKIRSCAVQFYISILQSNHNEGAYEKVAECLSWVLRYKENQKIFVSEGGPSFLRRIVASRSKDQGWPSGTRALALAETEEADNFNLPNAPRLSSKHCATALENLNKIVDLNPGNATLLCRRGFLRAQLKDPAGALEDLNKAVSLEPKNLLALQERGFLKSSDSIRDYDGALVDLNKTLRMGGEKTTFRYSILKYRAFVKFRLGDADGALFEALQALCVRFVLGKSKLPGRQDSFGSLPILFSKFEL
ncbi:hypothetical protein R1flu_015475 [Riccia fluitans]|uniref:Tetratricopeptide repeat protein n=1 Tax=Riccia fluitans TaxID=41844 RepID=A0ABD1YM77_9MARC